MDDTDDDPEYGPYSVNKFPWLVAMTSSELNIHWTGTLVSDQFIVTSASMFETKASLELTEKPFLFFAARPASPDFLPDEIPLELEGCKPNCKPRISKFVKIERIFIHPYYLRKIDNVHQHELPSDDLSYNVALFKLETRLDFYSEYSFKAGIRPICLPKPGEMTVESARHKGLLFGRNLEMHEARIVGEHQITGGNCWQVVRPTKLYRYALCSKLSKFCHRQFTCILGNSEYDSFDAADTGPHAHNLINNSLHICQRKFCSKM